MQEYERTNEEPLTEGESDAICSNQLLEAMRERMAKRKKRAKEINPEEREREGDFRPRINH